MSSIFNIADQFFSIIPIGYQSAVALLLLVFFSFSIFRIIKKSWPFLLIGIILIPGAWAAVKILTYQILAIIGFFLYRI